MKKLSIILTCILLAYLLLLIPERELTPLLTSEEKQFSWGQDDVFQQLERQFQQAKTLTCDSLDRLINRCLSDLQKSIDSLTHTPYPPTAPIYTSLENQVFSTATKVACCPGRLPDYIQAYARLRHLVKQQSHTWDLNTKEARKQIYRLLYGTRAALEEVMLQAPPALVPPLVLGYAEPSATPAASILGVKLHSGDILVSRGGAPTSALIARGNDFPGNFSHIAFVHVDDKFKIASIIESLIECGVTISSLEKYLKDTKLRVMVLRPRADLPQLQKDPLLPHQAAVLAFEDAKTRHIPYDFEMNHLSSDQLFCSEVASAPYRQLGINLWMGISHISSPGTKSWLAAFGVRFFETQEPSDLEYDPQLTVVAEWRDMDTLWHDHVDNAVIDAMLKGAEAGDQLGYPRFMLPFARMAKVYSVILNTFGVVGPVPEGMSATKALRNKSFSHKHHRIKLKTLALADQYKREKGYLPPYWELVKLAKKVK